MWRRFCSNYERDKLWDKLLSLPWSYYLRIKCTEPLRFRAVLKDAFFVDGCNTTEFSQHSEQDEWSRILLCLPSTGVLVRAIHSPYVQLRKQFIWLDTCLQAGPEWMPTSTSPAEAIEMCHATTLSSTPSDSTQGANLWIVIGVCVGTALIATAAVACVCIIRRQRAQAAARWAGIFDLELQNLVSEESNIADGDDVVEVEEQEPSLPGAEGN